MPEHPDREAIEVDHDAMLRAARREAEMWRTAKDQLAVLLNAAEAENTRLRVLLGDAAAWLYYMNRKVVPDWAPNEQAVFEKDYAAIRAALSLSGDKT